jgi:N-acetylglucosaminyldiphosphoundecaprenol N-acetyl-beta-D-mannosaminyltransferase
MMSYANSRINIGNVLMDNVTMQETLDAIERYIARGSPCYIITPNVDHVIIYNRDVEFEICYNQAALCLADGMPILWASKFLGTPLIEKVSGSDLVPRLCELAHIKEYKLFFLGGRPGAAEAAKQKLHQTLINLKVVGTYAPPLGFEKDELELKKIALMIKEAKPDILFVGLGAPKQERWIKKYYQELGVPVSIGVGVTFEFIAGIVKRAPKWMQSTGLEWFWRLCMEPGRLWKRYLIDDMQFFGLILKQKLRGIR